MLRAFNHYVKVIRDNPAPLRFLVARALVRTGLCRHLVIRNPGGYALRFFPSNLSEQLWLNPSSRDEGLAFFSAYLREGDTVVDVGANIGDTCIVCSRAVGPHGRVFAFEPHPRVYAWLVENLRLNGVANVTCSNVAVGENEGSVSFSDQRRDDMNRVVADGEGLRIPVKRIDALVGAETGNVELLKVDVEGFEIFVLRGGPLLLSRTQAAHIEVAPAHFSHYGYSTRDLLLLLEGAGFRLYRFVTEKGLLRVDAGFVPAKVENLVASRDPSRLRERIAPRGFTLVEKTD